MTQEEHFNLKGMVTNLLRLDKYFFCGPCHAGDLPAGSNLRLQNLRGDKLDNSRTGSGTLYVMFL